MTLLKPLYHAIVILLAGAAFPGAVAVVATLVVFVGLVLGALHVVSRARAGGWLAEL